MFTATQTSVSVQTGGGVAQKSCDAPKARNIKTRGKRRTTSGASPLVSRQNFLNRALKVRNTDVDYSALSELHDHCARFPRATRLTLFGACPWLSYYAPLALRLRLLTGQPRQHELCKRRDQFLDVWHADARNHVVAGSSRERSVAS